MVFSEEASQRLPPSEEQKVTKEFLDEHLKSGIKSPQALGFFLVGKKDSSLQPCQDYRHLNKYTTKDSYPLPLISNLVDKVKDTTIFSKFDVRWGYNNIRIKEGDQWKAAFITHKGLFKPTVMFFGLSNSPPTFQ